LSSIKFDTGVLRFYAWIMFTEITLDTLRHAPDPGLAVLPPPPPLDFGDMPLEGQTFVMAARSRIVRRLGQAAIETGQDLLRVKAEILKWCPRGTWTIWLRTAVEISESTARNCMAAAEWAAKSPTVGVLAPGALYRGAVAPPEVQEKIVALIGEHAYISADTIGEMIKNSKVVDISPSASPNQDVTKSAPDQAEQNELQASECTVTNEESELPSDEATREDDIIETGEDESGLEIDQVEPQAEDLQEDVTQPSPSLSPSLDAANQIVERLRASFDDAAIIQLVMLWNQTRSELIIEVLDCHR